MDGQVSHDDYYAQFVTPEVKAAVARRFGNRLYDSTDPHLNDLPLKEWDSIIGWIDGRHEKIKNTLGVAKSLRDAGDSVSCGTLICVLKAAGRQMIADYRAKVPA
jgi:hypothetical protein